MKRLIAHKIILLLGALFAVLLNACSTTREFSAPDASNYTDAELPGFQNVRFWADEDVPREYMDYVMQKVRQDKELEETRFDLLALSGGGDNGAYGAGYMCGWSQRGDRPEFDVVTGISTGSMIAVFAFLGPDYDNDLKHVYTDVTQKSIVKSVPLISLLLGADALGNTAPLKKLIEKYVDDDMVAQLAHQSSRGRVLWIGTTDLDAQRPVIWDIGKIAESQHPGAKTLIQEVILASASIPGAFNPVLIDVTIDGKPHQEMHVDGGVTRQIFAWPVNLDTSYYENKYNDHPKQVNLWLIRNAKVSPQYHASDLSFLDIVKRSIGTLTKFQGRADMYDIIYYGRGTGAKVEGTYIPDDFNHAHTGMFDTAYMRALFDVGYQKALSQRPWDSGELFNQVDRLSYK